jgi:hypothetical protein
MLQLGLLNELTYASDMELGEGGGIVANMVQDGLIGRLFCEICRWICSDINLTIEGHLCIVKLQAHRRFYDKGQVRQGDQRPMTQAPVR